MSTMGFFQLYFVFANSFITVLCIMHIFPLTSWAEKYGEDFLWLWIFISYSGLVDVNLHQSADNTAGNSQRDHKLSHRMSLW